MGGVGQCPNHTKWKVFFFIDELVSHTNIHGGSSPSNLYDNTGDGHSLHSDVHVWARARHTGPTIKNLCCVHMVQLCCSAIVFSCWGGMTTI